MIRRGESEYLIQTNQKTGSPTIRQAQPQDGMQSLYPYKVAVFDILDELRCNTMLKIFFK